MPNPIPLRLFLSSPGDVSAERGKVRAVVNEINHDPMYNDKVTIEVVAWDDPHSDVVMPVTLTPQQAIDLGMPRPSECDICITILWGRMGTPLDTDAHGTKADGTPYLSGTEWEYLDAVNGARGHGTGFPVVYLYRRTDDVPDPKARSGQTKADAFIEHGTQMKRVEDFFKPLRDSVSGAMRGFYHEYAGIDAFVELIERHIRTLAKYIYEKKRGDSIVLADVEDAPPLPLRWDIDKDGSPFPGLRVFTEKYKPVFFGRNREVTQVIRRMASQRLLVIVGASGSGKSSLVRAGVLPSLSDNALPPSAKWQCLTMRPTARPFLALAEILVTQIPMFAGDPDISLIERCELLAALLKNSPSELVHRLTTAYSGQASSEIVLFIDQAEELFTLAEPDEAQALLVMLRQPSEHLRLLLAIRSDFYDALLPHLEDELREATYTLAKPSPFALMEMIIRPAEVAGLNFDDDLPETIIREAGNDSGALALIAYTLEEMYKMAEARHDRRLALGDYAALEGVQGAIGKRAELMFATLPEKNKESLLAHVFRELIEVDERGIATRQRSPIRRFDEAELSLVYVLTDARLLVMDDSTIEVAHEALFRSWKRLETWISSVQEDMILLRQLRIAAYDWHTKERPKFLLWPQERLSLVYAMQQRLRPKMNEVEQDFIEPEILRLLRELDNTKITHERRRDIGDRLAVIGDTRSGIGVKNGIPDLLWLSIEVPQTPVTIVTNEIRFEDVLLAPFFAAKYLITHAQYQTFLDAPNGFENMRWWERIPDKYKKQEVVAQRTKMSNAPRDSISWYQCVAYARWLNNHLYGLELHHSSGQVLQVGENAEVRLPLEWEWQWVAQGGLRVRRYPWGDWKDGFANTAEAGLNRTTAVGMYPHGSTDSDGLDLAGNLCEWCQNDKVKFEIIDGYDNEDSKALRGGGFNLNKNSAASAVRSRDFPGNKYYLNGFRLVISTPLESLISFDSDL